MVQMSQFDSVCTKKTCLSHMFDISVGAKHTLNSSIHIKSVVLIVAIFYLSLRSRKQVKT